MKRLLLTITALAMGILICVPIVFAEGETTGKIDKAALREMVLEIIRENPKVVYDSINSYIKVKQAKKQKGTLEESFKKRIKDTVNAHNPIMGPEDAPITIIEYTDFECPYCTKGATTMKNLLKKYPKIVRVVFKNNPLKMHQQAVPAAAAALAAGRQGKFWEYHDLLFKNSSKLGEEKFVEFAEELSLDMKKFDDDRNSEEISKQVTMDMDQASKNGLRGTPSFVVNGVVVRGSKPVSYFDKIIKRLLSEKQKSQK